MDTRVAGGILLIVGTSIGGGMLALPIAAAGGGFLSSTLLLIFCWLLMTFSAFLILEVNLWLPPRTNMISMARATLGRSGELVAWLSYLLLMYALMAAYTSGGSALFNQLFRLIHFDSPAWLDSATFVLVFGYIVYCGIKPVDYVNRALMISKLGSLVILILFCIPYLDQKKLLGGQPLLLMGSITVMITSFGYATIIPSLRSYFDGDVKKLRRAILIGSLIPLICYIFWDMAILGVLPSEGDHGLMQVMHRGGAVDDLTDSLSYYLQNASITTFAGIFTAICVLTSFLGVSLGLSDFLADGCRIQKKGLGNVIVFALTFLPPLLIVLFYPSIFVKALSYAGIFCVVLIVLLPALMVFSGRYYKKMNTAVAYQVRGGAAAVLLSVIASIVILAFTILQH